MRESAGDRFGALLALAAASLGFAGVVTFALAPPEQQSFAATPDFLGSVAAGDAWLRASFFLSTMFALAAAGTAAAIGRVLGAGSSSLALAATVIGVVGYAVTALQNATDLAVIPAAAARYTEEGLVPTQLARIDPSGFLQALAIGTWLGVVAMLGRRRADFPLWLAILGVAAATAFLLAAASAASGPLGEPSVVLTLLVAGVVIPAWFLGLARVLVRFGARHPPVGGAG